jgi:hypothetical protein
MERDAPTLYELDHRFQAMAHQRNAALDEVVYLRGEIGMLNARIRDLEHLVAINVATDAQE